MKELQKIKKMIIILIIMSLFTLTCAFYNFINPFFIKIFSDKFNIYSCKENLMVHFISIGQGDAIAVNLPDGKVMLIDTGLMASNVKYTDYINDKVLNGKRNKKIDYLILSHADADHIGGTMLLLKKFNVGKVYMPAVYNNTITYNEIVDYVENNIKYEYITVGMQFNTSGYSVDVFGPLDFSSTNNSCPVIKISYLGKSFLFTGDIEEEVEDDFIASYGEGLDSDVLKVAHHGSSSSSSLEFLQYVSPRYAVISVAKNSYGHPASKVVDNLNEVDAQILRTDLDGNVMFVVGKNYNLKYKTGTYYITNLSLDYRYLILVIDGCLFIQILVVLIKKDKKSKKKLKNKE